MNKTEINDELMYQLTMKYADELLKLNVITEEDYATFQSLLLKKYKPFISEMTCY